MSTLFAPIVDMQQPAVMWQGQEKYFKISIDKSGFNSWADIDKIRVILSDPAVNSTLANNTLLNLEALEGESERIVRLDPNYQVYYIAYDKPADILDNQKILLTIPKEHLNLEKLNTNKFYQAQVYFTKGSEISDDYKYSPTSQVTLVRAINPLTLTFAGANGSEIDSLSSITCQVSYENGDPGYETVFSYQYEIQQKSGVDWKKVDSTPMLFNPTGSNTLVAAIDYFFEKNAEYRVLFTYTTKNGYSPETKVIVNNGFTFVDLLANKSILQNFSMTISPDKETGGLILENTFTSLEWLTETNGKYGILCLQRKSEFEASWTDVAKFDFSETTSIESVLPVYFKWRDNSVGIGLKYSYRFYYQKADGTITGKYELLASAEDSEETNMAQSDAAILADKDTLLSIMYNLNISNLKWVVQESIVNPLGGKFPVVRRGGESRYKQFSLSGTLYMDYNGTEGDRDSLVDPISGIRTKTRDFYISRSEPGLYFSTDKAKDFLPLGSGNYTIPAVRKRMRDEAINFLTNGQFKLFKSQEEGNMIVYLSAISFTPNKSLGNQVYDFSATVTEVMQATEENLQKFNFKNQHCEFYSLQLEVSNVIDNSAYISVDQVLNSNSVVLRAKAVSKNVI